jgi:hypothetical protein
MSDSLSVTACSKLIQEILNPVATLLPVTIFKRFFTSVAIYFQAPTAEIHV